MCPLRDANIVSELIDYNGGVLDIEEHAIKVTVPFGAIEKNNKVQIEAAASLFGPFEIPEDYQPISVYVWIGACYKFLKPVKVEIEHCATITQQEDLSELCVLTADTKDAHEKEGQNVYKMHEDSCQFQYSINEISCALSTEQFCSKCLAKRFKRIRIPNRLVLYHLLPMDYKTSVEFIAETCFCYDLKFCKKV